jgi:hypothetical protein
MLNKERAGLKSKKKRNCNHQNVSFSLQFVSLILIYIVTRDGWYFWKFSFTTRETTICTGWEPPLVSSDKLVQSSHRYKTRGAFVPGHSTDTNGFFLYRVVLTHGRGDFSTGC